VGWVVRAGGVALFFAGDSGLGSHFQTIGNRYRPQLAILPIGAYAPAWPLRRYHLSPEDAVEAAARLGVELVIPAHFGTFRLALDRPDDALPRFARAAQERGLRWAMPRFYSPLPAGIATMASDPEPRS
jgi:L-ascorbate metabolism protein UlaG (beta-lactamase superfamily)